MYFFLRGLIRRKVEEKRKGLDRVQLRKGKKWVVRLQSNSINYCAEGLHFLSAEGSPIDLGQ